jgi:protein TonB
VADPPDPAPPEITVEPEAEEEPEAAPPVEEERPELEDAMRGPAPIAFKRIPPLRRREPPPAPSAAPVPREAAPPAQAAGAPVVRSAFPRSEGCRPPGYPAAERRLGHEGRVLLRALVGTDGVPRSVDVEESSGHPALDEAAAAAVRGWVFEPAREGDRVIESLVRVPIRFRLRR